MPIAMILLSISPLAHSTNYSDEIIAIVNDRVILKSEVQDMIDNLSPEIIAKKCQQSRFFFFISQKLNLSIL